MDYVTNKDLQISKLTLGTAQLGSTYGIANIVGQPDYQTAGAILRTATERGITCFDTAPAYGESERIIGNFIFTHSYSGSPPLIISKLPPFPSGERADFNSVYSQVKLNLTRSLKNLGIDKIPVYLLHRASDMQIYDGLVMESCLKLKDEGLIGLTGVSVYFPQEVELALKMKIDAVQVPLNIFDHRLLQSGLLNRLKEKRVLVFARSVFLQGLFFLDENKLPLGLTLAREPLKKLHQLVYDSGMNTAGLALRFVRDLPGVTSLVVGAETPQQVIANVDLINSPPISSSLRDRILDLFSDMPLELINPCLWKL